MKQWVRLHPRWATALALLVEWLILAVVFLLFGRPLLDASIESGMWTAASGIVWAFESRRSRRTAARLDEHGQVLAYVRYPDSRPGSLSGIWNMGIATPQVGWIDFQPAVYDTLEPSGRPMKIQVLEVRPERRAISGRERKYVSGLGNQAMTVVTETGRVEIAGDPDSLDKLADAAKRRP
ncbi:hypothetical protein AHIS1636_31970 [Arthrobacter mangrovi]|uniref:Uncharacterized protein n=2 Tax=Arthrobacter mangrovi TaxID=2966350 RepID=A0ABQ5MY47_9MICC|nr:hypothetical protein AHIS1636_31970 [Arthrobacter mangrovi]